MDIGRRIYYNNRSGEVILDKGEMQGDVTPTTEFQDIFAYDILSQTDRDTYDYVDLAYGEFSDEFTSGLNYKVDPKTKTLVFTKG